MNYYVFYNELGQIHALTTDQDSFRNLNRLDVGETPIDPRIYLVKNGSLEKLPPRPEVGNHWIFDYTNKIWAQNTNAVSADVKKKRQELLLNSDWTQLPNSPLSAEQQTAWATYRQALRDIPTQSGYPATVVWPTPPQ